MENKFILGLDPGQNGGIAVLNNLGDVVSLVSMPETPGDILFHLQEMESNSHFNDYEIVAYLEDVGRGLPGQSSSATAKFARHNGHLEMALLALGIKTVMVTPQKWEKTYQLGKSSDYSKTEWKNKLKAKAQQLFPSQKITLKTADALLIAEYGRNQEK